MGTSIQLFVERKLETNWFSMTGGSFDINRDYTLFSLLAGVRGDKEPVYKPRGLPDNPSKYVESNFYRWVVVDDLDDCVNGYPPYRPVKREQYKDAKQSGHVIEHEYEKDDLDSPMFAYTDHYKPSWLKADEFTEVVEKYFEIYDGDDTRKKARLHALMSYIFHLSQEFDIRIVFWFH